MPTWINMADQTGFGLSEMSRAMSNVPRLWGRVGELGIFGEPEGVRSRTVEIDIEDSVMSLLPPVADGAPSTQGKPDSRRTKAFSMSRTAYTDNVLPEDVQDVRQTGSMVPETMANVMAKKTIKAKRKHDQTHEYQKLRALQGTWKAGNGETLMDWHAEFGVTQKVINFDLDNARSDILTACRELLDHLEDNLDGDMMTSVRTLVSREFFGKFIKHPSVKEAYTFYQNSNGKNPLRDDTRSGFMFGDVFFEPYGAVFTLSTGSTDRAFPAGEGIAFPMGTNDTFQSFCGPAVHNETVNQIGLPFYSWMTPDPKGRGYSIDTESRRLFLVRRPKLVVKLVASA